MTTLSGWEFGTSSHYVDRKNQMLSLRRSGFTLRRIGEDFGISRQRVWQIIGSVGYMPKTKKILQKRFEESSDSSR